MTVWDGVYTAAQADRGADVYREKCAQCHENDLSGYHGVLRRERFLEHWRETKLESFYTTLSSTMPRDVPASLTERMYLDVLGFVLRADGFPAGASELTANALPNIRVEEKTGAREVPTGAMVEVVGCLAAGPDHAWTLTAATDPLRIRSSAASTPEELKASGAKPPGTNTFGLMDAVYFKPESHRGQRVEVKGLLIRNPSGDRINLTTFQATDTSCEP